MQEYMIILNLYKILKIISARTLDNNCRMFLWKKLPLQTFKIHKYRKILIYIIELFIDYLDKLIRFKQNVFIHDEINFM